MYFLKTKPVQILIPHRHDSFKKHPARPDTNNTTTIIDKTKQNNPPHLENHLLCQKSIRKKPAHF